MGGTASVHKVSTTDLVIPGVHIQDERNCGDYAKLLSLNGYSSIDLIKWVAMSAGPISKIKNKPKATSDDVFKDFQDLFVKEILGEQKELPHGYLHFGDNNCRENLSVFFKTNPFFVSALQARRNDEGNIEFYIKSFNKASPTLFQQSVAVTTKDNVLVDATFDSNMVLTHIQASVLQTPDQTLFVWSQGQPEDSVEIENYCSHLLFNVANYSATLHAVIHVVHYMLDCAIIGTAETEEDSKDINTFTKPYIPNVALKYFEVKSLLFGEKGMLSTSLHVARNMLVALLKCATAHEYLTTVVLKGVLEAGGGITVADVVKMGVLEQFVSHCDLVTPYANELCAAFEASKTGSVSPFDAQIHRFFSDVYKNPTSEELSTILTFNAWIQLFSVTGITHGATLSFTRAMVTAPFVKLLTPDKNYGSTEVGAVTAISATIVGILKEHYVFSDKLYSTWLNTHEFDAKVTHVMKKFMDASDGLKHAYLTQLKADPTHFARFGWILSDYCPDGVDGKQLTISTYI